MPDLTQKPPEQHTPGDLYTLAVAFAHCPTHRAQLEESEARHAAYGESISRRDRLTLGLRSLPPRQVTEGV